MTTAKRQNPKPFTPVKGEIYENAGGGRYIAEADGYEDDGRRLAPLTNIVSGWTFIAKGIVRYEDGTIEWDWSTGGHFVTLDHDRQNNILAGIASKVQPEEIRHRQRSMMNAMLCCLI